MMPGKYDINIFRGSTWSITLEVAGIDFSKYDLVRMQIRPPWVKGFPRKKPLIELTLDNNRIRFEDNYEKVVLYISATDTTKLSFNEGAYDLEFIIHANPGVTEEVVDKLIYGSVFVKGEKTV